MATRLFLTLVPMGFLLTGIRLANCHGEENAPAATQWMSLFDGKTLAGWKNSEFGGDGEIAVEDGAIDLGMGAVLTGVTYNGDHELPKLDYEIRLQAKRINGNDFFCGLTVPYKDSHISLIIGGWGGGLVGLSSLNNHDASENETSSYRAFQNGQWYRIRLRVQEERIEAWIDEEQVVKCQVRNRTVSTRPEVDLSKPLGLSAFQTRAALRDIELRRLDANDDKARQDKAK